MIVVWTKGWHRRTGASVGIDDGNALLAGAVLEETLLGAVVASAGQAGQVDEDGDFGGRALESLRWKEQVELHLAVCGSGLVGKLQELAAERGDGGSGFDRHDCVVAAEDWDKTEWEKEIDMMDIKEPRNDERPKRYSNPIFSFGKSNAIPA